ncbi:MAG: transcriptional regulator [Actinobacteria bacterium HGW-Actinobacteria-7]|jgi:predicted XRE-type DNA-binding protein|nr:MAG: transcriptional regulator [Actinobacteria bacterium HGW-Actinobacteria-7]
MIRRADTASENPGPRAVRVALAREISGIVSARGLNQREVAALLGTTQPKVSALMALKVEGFSLDRLVMYLNRLGEDIHIVVLPKPPEREHAHTWVINPASVARAGG